MAHGKERKVFAFVEYSGGQIVNLVGQLFLRLAIAFCVASEVVRASCPTCFDLFATEGLVKT